MAYDPRAHGARCDDCVLQGCPSVAPSLRRGSVASIVGHYPTVGDVQESELLVGRPGQALDHALQLAGTHRGKLDVNAALLCSPPGGDSAGLDKLLRQIADANKLIAKENRVRRKAGEPPEPLIDTPHACCAPRLARELAGKAVLALGGEALTATAPHLSGPDKRTSITSMRGSLIEHEGRRVFPTIQPSYALRQLRWIHVFYADVKRALAWFAGEGEGWQDPEILTVPQPDELAAFLDWLREQPFGVVDVETDRLRGGPKPLLNRLYCIGIGTRERVAVVPILGVDGKRRFYPAYEQRQIEQLVREYLECDHLKVGHNLGFFDKIVLRSQLGATIAPIVDTVLAVRCDEPELPRGLGFVASIRLPGGVPPWKSAHAAELRTDENEWVYNATDIAVNAGVLPVIIANVDERDQLEVLDLDHKIQEACVRMHTAGILVDQTKRSAQEDAAIAASRKALTEVRERINALGLERFASKVAELRDVDEGHEPTQLDEDLGAIDLTDDEDEEAMDLADVIGTAGGFNPGSPVQMRALLFDGLNLTPPPLKPKDLLTKSGDIATRDSVLRAMLATGDLNDEARAIILAVRRYRQARKRLGLTRAVRPRLYPWKRDHPADRGCMLYEDGRLHGIWNAHVPVTGRIASAAPNMQNWSGEQKKMLVAAPGYTFVGRDMEQIEFRLAAAEWGARKFLTAFDEGLDPYQIVMEAVFAGQNIWTWPGAPPTRFVKKGIGKKSQFDNMRTLAKTIHLASQYGASLETIHMLVQKASDRETGELLFLHLKPHHVKAFYRGWSAGVPEYLSGWDRDIAEWKRNGFLRERVTGRRRDFLDQTADKANRSEIVNFKIQAGAAGAMNRATARVLDVLDEHPTWEIVAQVHDFLGLHVPEADAERASELLRQCMEVDLDAYPQIRILTESGQGRTLAEA